MRQYTASSVVPLTVLTCWAGPGSCVKSRKVKLSVASSRLLESRTETKNLGPDQPAEPLGGLSVGAESPGWSQVPGRPRRGDVSVFGDEDGNPDCQSRADLKGQPVLVFILQRGKLRPREQKQSTPLPVPTPQGHTASCNRVRDGAPVFKTQRKGSGQWLRLEAPGLERLSLPPWGLHRGGPEAGVWCCPSQRWETGDSSRELPRSPRPLHLSPSLRSHLTVGLFGPHPYPQTCPSQQRAIDDTDGVLLLGQLRPRE